MAKKTAKASTPKSGGWIKIIINEDGSYDISTRVTPTQSNLLTYAQVLSDMLDGKFQSQLATIFSGSPDSVNQQIGQFLIQYLKKYKTASKPLIPADKVFKQVRIK